MTTTLGFGAFGYLESLFDESTAAAIFVALAKHSPKQPLRLVRQNAVTDLDYTGKATPCGDAPAILAAVKEASSVEWPNRQAPLGVAPVLLPGNGWELRELREEPVIKSEAVSFHLSFDETTNVRGRIDAECERLFDVAEKYWLVLVLH